MNTKFTFLFGALVSVGMVANADAAVTVKKAAPVATQSASALDSSASLMGTALNLISSVQQLNIKQKELTSECVPTQTEINFVDKTIKEWAKTGAMSADETLSRLNRRRCAGGAETYKDVAMVAEVTKVYDQVCVDVFNSATSDKDMVWFNYPKAGIANFCPDGSKTCKNQKTVSNIYEIFNLVDFSEADYTQSEATMAGKLIAKIEKCSNAKLSAKKRAMWAEFLTDTFSNIGQKTNTGNILQQVSTVTSSGGGLGGALGGLGSLGGMAAQYLEK